MKKNPNVVIMIIAKTMRIWVTRIIDYISLPLFELAINTKSDNSTINYFLEGCFKFAVHSGFSSLVTILTAHISLPYIDTWWKRLGL